MSRQKFIRDSIHGNLPLTDFEVEVLDYPQLQRLRRVKQLGFISLIYPGANHSRFEHSIGTMHLASKLAEQLELEEDEKELVRIAGLLHDTGHGPFSHVSEAVFDVPHEELTAIVVKETSLADKLSERFDTNLWRIGYGPYGLPYQGFPLYWSGLWCNRYRKNHQQLEIKKGTDFRH